MFNRGNSVAWTEDSWGNHVPEHDEDEIVGEPQDVLSGPWKLKKKKKLKRKKSVIPWVKVLEVFQVCQLSQLGFPGLTDSDSQPDCQNYDWEANSCSFLVTRLYFPVKPPCGTIVPLSAQEGNLWFLLETGECQAHSSGCWLRVWGHLGLEGSPVLWRWTAMQERLSPSGWVKILIL